MEILTLREAAAFLRVHHLTLARRALEWGVPHKRLGQEWRFVREELEEWMKE